uniref:Bm3717 n=1 Tax=Brugia malayi TaxID=6279 RepID=A0A1I9GD63_BRUMA|nr:Bm3717 [Brugia malayi]
MTTKNGSDYLGDGRDLYSSQCGENSGDTIQLESSDESFENENTRGGRFWQLMRACAQRKVRVHSYSFRHQQFCTIGNVVLHSKARTNLRKHFDSNDVYYYDVASVIQLCNVIKTSTYEKYLKKLSKQKFKCLLAVAESVFQQLKPYLLGETEAQPSAIDPNGPVPLLKETSSINEKRLQEKASISSTVRTRAMNEQITVDGTEGEFFENPCYMEFLMNWLMHTNLECVKSTCIIRLTTEQQIELNTKHESCHHVSMTINHLPASHFFGSGFGFTQKKAFWAASRSIVRRLYYAGFITPILYHTIGKSGRSEFSGKIKRWKWKFVEWKKEWKFVKDTVECFRNTMTIKMPHWIQLTKNGFSTEEFVKMIDDLLNANRLTTQKREMKLNELVKRKRSGDELKTHLIETKKNRDSYTKAKIAKTAIANNKDFSHGDCAAMERVKVKPMITLENRSVNNSIHGNLAYREIADDADVILEDEEILPPVNIHTISVPSSHFSSSGSKYGTLCSLLGVSYVEETLAIRSVIKEKRTTFAKEFKSFDEHIWRHFQINVQDDRTFSWKMTVRQKLLALVRQVYKDSNLIAVGSTVNGCGSYNSDMDLCICQPYKNHSFEANRSYSIHVLRKLHKKFVTDWRQMFKTCQYIPAKVPIIKLEMAAPYEELEIDINCNNVAGIYNSHLLHYYSRVDDRFPALCLLVKHWAINAGINNAMMGTLNSYSLILMVLHFLQCGALPPVLPNLQFLYPSLFNATCSLDSLELFRDLPHPLPPREFNTETVGELLIAFFDYFAHFDFKNKAISIRNGCVYSRDLLADNTMRFKIFIEEPYDQRNTARCVTSIENLQLIREAFTSARNAFLQTWAGPPNLECIGVH